MKKVLIFLLFSLLLSGTAYAEKGTGLGIVLGEPTGVSFKSWLGGDRAVDGAAAWSFGDNDALHVHADYLFHKFGILKVKSGKLPLYYGVGGRIAFASDVVVGVRVPVGLSYILPKDPLDIFVEVAPVVNLAPSTKVDFNGGIGVRYWFR